MSDQLMSKTYPMVACTGVIGMALVCTFLEPDEAYIWLGVAAMLPVAWSFLALKRRGRAPSNEVRRSIFFASLMLIISLAFAAGASLDLFDAEARTWVSRAYGIAMGGILIFMGNYMPKHLPPLDETKYDGAKVQMLQRFAGWALVLAGIGYALAWFALPTMTANIVASGLVLLATALILSRRAFTRLST